MNSFFGNLNSGFLQNISTPIASQPQQPQPNLLLMAFGAAIRGEDPKVFMSNLAQQHPLLKQYDLTNLQNTAQQVCQQNNVDMQGMINKIDNFAKPMIGK